MDDDVGVEATGGAEYETSQRAMAPTVLKLLGVPIAESLSETALV